MKPNLAGISYTVKSSSFTAEHNKVYHLRTETGAITVTFPSPQKNSVIYFEDISSYAATNNVTFQTPGAETIDGFSSVKANTNGFLAKFTSDGTNWFELKNSVVSV